MSLHSGLEAHLADFSMLPFGSSDLIIDPFDNGLALTINSSIPSPSNIGHGRPTDDTGRLRSFINAAELPSFIGC